MIQEFLLRCAISGSIACVLYFVSASIVARYFNRKVSRDIVRHDIKLGIVSLLFGSPLLQVFAVAHEKWGVSRVYTQISCRCRCHPSDGTSCCRELDVGDDLVDPAL